MNMRDDILSVRPDIKRVSAFGIDMRLVEAEDLPLLCTWRNHPAIRPFMDDCRPVTPQVMAVWLNKKRTSNSSLAYICYAKQAAVGFTELKNIDWEQRRCEGGIFLFGEEYFGTGLAYAIALCREIVLQTLGIPVLISRVRKNNVRGMKFCKKYGGEFEREEDDFLIFTHKYECRMAGLQHLAQKIGMATEFSQIFKP